MNELSVRKKMWVFLLFLFLCSDAFSQTINLSNPAKVKYRFFYLGLSQGLPSCTVNCLFKDSKGFLWMGTSSELNRFDDHNIEVFDPDPSDTLVLQSNDHQKNAEGPFGNLWIENMQGISIFNPSTEKFSDSQFALLKEMSLPEKEVREIYLHYKGHHWFIHDHATTDYKKV